MSGGCAEELDGWVARAQRGGVARVAPADLLPAAQTAPPHLDLIHPSAKPSVSAQRTESFWSRGGRKVVWDGCRAKVKGWESGVLGVWEVENWAIV